MVRRAINRSGYKDLIPAGAVITGGSINIDGSQEIAEKVLGIPVRIGQPNSVGGLSDHTSNPLYATGVGLLLYGVKSGGEKMIKIKDENVMKKVIESMKNWFKEFF